MTVVAGVDFGTLSVRVTLVDSKKGPIGTASANYPLHRRREDPDYATQSHADHMSAMAQATREVLQTTGINGNDVAAIAIDTTGSTVLPLGEGMAPLDHKRIADAIEGTRFPAAAGQEYGKEASIVRAADFIGQLGDPNYLRKANALYHEFEEVGVNRQLGYDSPADIVNRYPQFYWDSVAPHIQTEIRYLNKTSSGRQWIANLYSNVFRAERDISLSGPQK